MSEFYVFMFASFHFSCIYKTAFGFSVSRVISCLDNPNCSNGDSSFVVGFDPQAV